MFLKTGYSVKLTSTRYEVIQAKISVEVTKQNKEKIEIVRWLIDESSSYVFRYVYILSRLGKSRHNLSMWLISKLTR